ncbi:hypothetical protein GCK32_020594 [Trichostrongylus colubriformis]|uniref:Uncharacterized protein n=1 Tax=Trichostrongylus colubriformis TaxID=6319 RepID=A0AAN8EWG4_TRICO
MQLILLSLFVPFAFCQNAADLEFSPYVYSAVKIPFKNSNYAKDWFGSDVALVQHPLLGTKRMFQFSRGSSIIWNSKI